MSIILEQEVEIIEELVGRSFYGSCGDLSYALREAQKYAGDKGFVASMPQLLHGRVVAPRDSEIWGTQLISLSEEDIGKTKQGNSVVIVIHGGGILGFPERLEKADKKDELMAVLGPGYEYVAELTEKEIKNALEGKLPNGKEIPVYSFTDFKKGIKDLPMNHAIVIDYNKVKRRKINNRRIDRLHNDPIVIMRSGGVKQAYEHLNRVKKVFGCNYIDNWHPFRYVNPDNPVGYLLGLFYADQLFSTGLNAIRKWQDIDADFVAVNAKAVWAYEKSVKKKRLEDKIQKALETSKPFKYKGTLYTPQLKS